jgi:shikimate dehydrogenase
MRRADPELLGVLGQPIAHSLSPAMHTAVLALEGRRASYHAFEVGPDELPAALAGLAAVGARGVNLTVPLKERAVSLMARLEPSASACGSVNTVSFEEDGPVGSSTDGEGFLTAVRLDLGLELAGRRVLVVGSGGAARAVAWAVRSVGGFVGVLARDPARAEAVAELAQGEVVVADRSAGMWDLIVNATTVGMYGGPDPHGCPVPTELLVAPSAVMDLVYAPRTTPLLRQARERSLAATDGLTMLAAQARASYLRWFASAPPVDVFVSAALAALEQRSLRAH